MAIATYYPPTSFYFQVKFPPALSPTAYDPAFQSVSGLNASIDTETIKEGGENRFEHKVPVRTKFGDLVLKRGLLRSSGVINWVRNAIENFEVEPIDIEIMLLKNEASSLAIWKCKHVWPKKWSVSDLNAEKGEILIESLELNCNYFKVEYPNS